MAIIVFASCSEKENNSPATLNITNSQWYLTRLGNAGGMVNLKLEGSTNGNKVTVRTYGDGVMFDANVELDSKKNFNKDLVISFRVTSVPSGEFEVNTKVMAYKDNDTLVVSLSSGKLKY